jgi:hypothetical protein
MRQVLASPCCLSTRGSLAACAVLLAVCMALLTACGRERAPSPAPSVETPPAKTPPAAEPSPSASTTAGSAADETPKEPTLAGDFGRVVGGVVAIQIDLLWGYAHIDGRWIVEPRAQAAASMTAERGWLTMEDGLELVDARGTQLASLPGASLVRVHDDGSATIERGGKAELIDRDGTPAAEPPPAVAEPPVAVAEPPPAEPPPAAAEPSPAEPLSAAAEPPPAEPSAAAAEPPRPPGAQDIDAGGELDGFSEVSDFVRGLGWGRKDGAVHCLRRHPKKGIIARRIRVDDVSEVHDGWLIVSRTKHLFSPCGYVDARCRVVVAPDELTTCKPFDETGLAYVERLTEERCMAGGYRPECAHRFAASLIDTAGVAVTDEYDVLQPLSGGLWRAGTFQLAPNGSESWQMGLLDPGARVDGRAKVLLPFAYDQLEEAGEGWFEVTVPTGKQLIQPGGRVLSLPPLPAK